MQKIRKIGILSVARISAITSAVIGIFIGLIYFLIGIFLFVSGSYIIGSLMLSSIILAPLGYGILGFLSGLIMAWVYNIVARKFGGIEIELEK
jgi:hypothetical protein